MSEKANVVSVIDNLISLTISIGFFVGGCIAYFLYDRVCQISPDQCDDPKRRAAFQIMLCTICAGIAISIQSIIHNSSLIAKATAPETASVEDSDSYSSESYSDGEYEYPASYEYEAETSGESVDGVEEAVRKNAS